MAESAIGHCPVCGEQGGFHREEKNGEYRGHLEARAAVAAELLKPKGWSETARRELQKLRQQAIQAAP